MGDSAELVGVGPVRMVRSFRVGADAGLYPVNTAEAWSDGWNTAICGRGKEHTPPDACCRCGFYAYSHPAYAGAQPPARQVLAVVAVQGEMEPGSRGARVQQARVEALWLGPRVSDDLAAAVARRYPSVAVFRDRAAMLAAFPLTPMTVFTPPRIGETGRRRLAFTVRAFLALVLVVGLIPTEQTLATPARAAGWLAILVVSFGIVAVGLAQRSAVLAMEGAAAMQWLLTAGPVNAAQWVQRGWLLLVVAWALLIWWRVGRPGQVVRRNRLDAALRRWRGRLPGTT